MNMYKLQWAFLEAKAKKTFHEQEKQAMVCVTVILNALDLCPTNIN